MIVIGIDPGKSGGFAVLFAGQDVSTHKMPATYPEIWDLLKQITLPTAMANAIAYMEIVHAMPGEGVSSVETFLKNVGHLEMACYGLGIPLHRVAPATWQKGLGVPTIGAGARPVQNSDYGETDAEFKTRRKVWQAARNTGRRDKKNALKQIAQERFPYVSVTLATCDALLIADYGRRMRRGLPDGPGKGGKP
jgi:crossover junction endodeoxyribonuclease RuvC